jgi:hypothetical protein
LQGGAEFDDPSSYQTAALRRVEEQVGADTMAEEKLIQYYALYCIFSSTHEVSNDVIVTDSQFDLIIPGWEITTGWTETNVDPCDGWFGVACESDEVVQLDLYSNSLTGNFAPEVTLLSSLTQLDLFNNPLLSNNGDSSWMTNLGSQMSKFLHDLSRFVPFAWFLGHHLTTFSAQM